MADPTVVVIQPESDASQDSQESQANSEREIAYGQLIETNRQAQERLQAMEAELSELRESRQSSQSQIAELSAQIDRLTTAIQEAAEEEEEEETTEGAILIAPIVEPEPEPEPEPERKAGLFERMCERINGI